MAENDKQNTENGQDNENKQESDAQHQQNLDDLTVLNNVEAPTLGGATLNVVRPTEGGASGLGNLALANEGGTFTPTTSQRAKVNQSADIGVDTATDSNQQGSGSVASSDTGGQPDISSIQGQSTNAATGGQTANTSAAAAQTSAATQLNQNAAGHRRQADQKTCKRRPLLAATRL